MIDHVLVTFALQWGSAGADEPIYGGTIVFGIAGAAVLYLSFVREEMDAGLQLKALGIALVLLAVTSALWPMRPWGG